MEYEIVKIFYVLKEPLVMEFINLFKIKLKFY